MKFTPNSTINFLSCYDLINHISTYPHLWEQRPYTLDCEELQLQIWTANKITHIGYFVNGRRYHPFTTSEQIIISSIISYFLPEPLFKPIEIKNITNPQPTIPLSDIPQPVIGTNGTEQNIIVRLTKPSELYKTLSREPFIKPSTIGLLSSTLTETLSKKDAPIDNNIVTTTIDSTKPEPISQPSIISEDSTNPLPNGENPNIIPSPNSKLTIKQKKVVVTKKIIVEAPDTTDEKQFKADAFKTRNTQKNLDFHNSILLWDLENISIENLESVRSLMSIKPTKEFIVTSQPLSKKTLSVIKANDLNVVNYHANDSDGVIRDYINAHKSFFDEFIIVSSDADFVPSVKELLDTGKKVQCIVREVQKSGVFSRLDGYSPNLTLSTI